MKEFFRSPWKLLFILAIVLFIVGNIVNIERTQRRSAKVMQLAVVAEAAQRQAMAAQASANQFRQSHVQDATTLAVLQQQNSLNDAVNRLNVRQNNLDAQMLVESAMSRPSAWWNTSFLFPFLGFWAFRDPKLYQWLKRDVVV